MLVQIVLNRRQVSSGRGLVRTCALLLRSHTSNRMWDAVWVAASVANSVPFCTNGAFTLIHSQTLASYKQSGSQEKARFCTGPSQLTQISQQHFWL